MNPTAEDLEDARAVLATINHQVDILDDETAFKAIEGKDVQLAKSQYGASLDIATAFDLLKDWGPIVLNALMIIKEAIALGKKEDKPATEVVINLGSIMEKAKNASRRQGVDDPRLRKAILELARRRGVKIDA
jgi:hypothetical protein